MNRVLLLFATLILVIPSFAQKSETAVWNWAWNRTTGELFAYSEDAEVNSIFNDIDDWVDPFWRIDQNRAVGLLRTVNDIGLYLVDHESVQPFSLDITMEELETFAAEGNGFRLDNYQYPYMLLSTWTPLTDTKPSRPVLLLNIETKQAILMNEHAKPGTFRFNDDVDRLRFATWIDEEGEQTAEIHELSLATGEDQVLHRMSGESMRVQPDKDGGRWLFSDWNREDDAYQYHLFTLPNGSEEIIYEDDFFESDRTYGFHGDALVLRFPLCATDCTIEIETPEGNTFSYDVPDTDGAYEIIYLSSNSTLIIMRWRHVWSIRFGGEPQSIGFKYSGGSHLPSSQSPDGQYILMADTESYPPSQRYILDLENGSTLFQVDEELEDPLYMAYLYEGFIVNTLERGPRMLYCYSDETITELLDIGYETYFEILPDCDVLYELVTGANETQIYRYSPQTNETLLLIEDVLRVPAVDFRLNSS